MTNTAANYLDDKWEKIAERVAKELSIGDEALDAALATLRANGGKGLADKIKQTALSELDEARDVWRVAGKLVKGALRVWPATNAVLVAGSSAYGGYQVWEELH
jgi:hypothetical protein